MYKILLADDEGIVTDSLQFIIEKSFGDECETAVAKSGRKAIELAETFQPDIAFLDIQMPGINGLKAMEEIRGLNPKVKVFILTAYDNFEYAKEALRLGAVDYLMKPVNKKMIVERLTGVMRDIDRERQKRQDDLQTKEKLEAVIPMIVNGFIISLIMQDGYEDGGEEYRTLLDLEEDYGTILTLEWGEKSEGNGMANPVGSGVRGHRYYDKMAELVKVYFHAYVSSIMGNKLVCVLPFPREHLAYEDRLRMIEKARSMVTALKNMVGADFKAGIGSVRPWESMFESYQESLNALRHGKRTVTHIDDLIVKDSREQEQQAMEQMVLRAVSGGIEHEARREATVFAGLALKNRDSTFEDARLRMVEMLLLARRTVQAQGGACPGGQEAMNALLSAPDGETLRQRFENAMVELARCVVIRKPESDGIIAGAQEYIRQHFQRDLSLEDVAAAAGISPYYFSKLFKEETGVNYTEYLTGIRIENAKRLLSNPKLSIKQVCVDSGYINPNYFSRIFKKWTGITPTEFRDQVCESR